MLFIQNLTPLYFFRLLILFFITSIRFLIDSAGIRAIYKEIKDKIITLPVNQ